MLREQKESALIVVDVQNDFLPGGALAVPHGDEVISPIKRLMSCGIFDVIVATQDWHPKKSLSFAANHPGKNPYDTAQLEYGEQVLWPVHCVAGTPGAQLANDIDDRFFCALIRKGTEAHVDSYSAFCAADGVTTTGLEGYLKAQGIKKVWLCGLATDFCVAYSAIDAAKAGFETTILPEACRAIDLNSSLAIARDNWRHAGVKEASLESTLALR